MHPLMLANRLGPELLNMKQNLTECLGPARQPAWQAFQACQEVAHQGEIERTLMLPGAAVGMRSTVVTSLVVQTTCACAV
jgi:hypothetical protein